jgi:hypothetical protein
MGAFCQRSNYLVEGVAAMTFFVCRSFDSSRILIELTGGEEKSAMQRGLVYFNTRTGKFEITDYLPKLNEAKAEVVACAEPTDPLPNKAELNGRLNELDQQFE